MSGIGPQWGNEACPGSSELVTEEQPQQLDRDQQKKNAETKEIHEGEVLLEPLSTASFFPMLLSRTSSLILYESTAVECCAEKRPPNAGEFAGNLAAFRSRGMPTLLHSGRPVHGDWSIPVSALHC